MIQEIYVIDEDYNLIMDLKRIFKNHTEYTFKPAKTQNLDVIFKNIPELIIINEDNLELGIEDVCKKIRQNEDNSITPIIVISSNENKEHKLDVIKNSVEYFVEKSLGEECIYYTIKNVLRLLSVNRTVSPLTRLPGNLQIQTELKKRLLRKDNFAVLYLDLDNFKAYNDIYGFLNGDEIIKLTAKIITKNVHCSSDADVFVGHIGGDDFVAVLDENVNFETICQNIIAEFDKEIIKHFNEEDIEQGYLKVQNRKGVVEEFPITSISIGVVLSEEKNFANILEIGEVGAQVKHLAKSVIGSSYAINRRRE